MFVVIVCTNCEGASQVDEATLGQVVQCPHCGKPTTARPKEAVLPVANKSVFPGCAGLAQSVRTGATVAPVLCKR